MRRGWMLLLGGLVVAYFAVDAAVSTLTLADRARRPLVALTRTVETDLGVREDRLEIAAERDFFGDQAEGTARPAGGVGMLLGYRYFYRVQGGGEIACGHILRWMWCERGWTPVRAQR